MPHRWDKCAILRREQIESGLDLTFAKVFLPSYRNLISRQEARTVLEVGAGTGHLAQALYNLVDEYVAIEPSDGMYKVATDVLAGSAVLLRQMRVEDLEHDRFYDVVLSHLCLQTVAGHGAFIASMSQHVAPSWALVLSIPHPCFYNEYKRIIPSERYRYMTESEHEISFTVTLDPDRAIIGVPYFHRPLSAYIRAISSSGFVVETVEEVFPPAAVQELYGSLWETPRYLTIVSRRYRY
jgi:2-polyprenyl-3-methyl-5-hydroxy-6-metoxy-1,4-benzoquinol methylase